MIEAGKVKAKKLPSDLIERNTTSLKGLSDQMNAIIRQTAAIEDHLQGLEMAKSYRDELRKKKMLRKLKEEERHSEDRISSLLDFSLTEGSPLPSKKVNKDAIQNQLGARYNIHKKGKSSNPSLRSVLNVINDMRREVSEIATRQNEMKFELEVLRGRLC